MVDLWYVSISGSYRVGRQIIEVGPAIPGSPIIDGDRYDIVVDVAEQRILDTVSSRKRLR
jgi:hypothetical protein